MIFAPDPELKAAALAALRTEYNMDSHRDGLHQSELAHCLTLAYNDITDPLPITDKEVLLFSIGFAMERVILKREATPEPVKMDGITMSLDTVELFGPSDIKTTRMRAAGRKGEDGFQPPIGWIRAFKAYARAMGVQSMGIIVMHLVEAEITAWRMSFSHEEIEQHWSWTLDRKRILEEMLENKTPLPFKFNEEQKVGSWDCQYCRYSLRCSLTASIEHVQQSKTNNS